MKNAVLVVAVLAGCFVAGLLLRNTRQTSFVQSTNGPTASVRATAKPAGAVAASRVPAAIATTAARIEVPADGRRIAAFEQWLRRFHETPMAGRDAAFGV